MPRIRTVKPDLWLSPQIMNVSHSARLLFIGLITQADDEGIGTADVRKLKASIFGGDDVVSVNVHGWLTELEKQDLVRLYTVEDSGDYYCLPTWKSHQVVNRPTPSRYPKPPDSKTLTEDSRKTHEGRKEGRKEGKEGKEGTRSRALDWKSIENLDIEAWNLWLAHRRSERLKPYSTLRTAKMLSKFPKEIQRAAIEESMDQNWQGLFPKKVKANGEDRTSRGTRLTFDEHTERLREWFDDELAKSSDP